MTNGIFPTASITESGCDESPLCYLTIRAPCVTTDVQTLVQRQQRNNQNQTLDIKSRLVVHPIIKKDLFLTRHVTGGAHFLTEVTLSDVTFPIKPVISKLWAEAP